jgi:phage host-nuclease inhibitor protein Gam
MATKSKKNAPVTLTIEQAKEAGQTYAEKSTRLEKVQTKMNEELNRVKTKYSEEITDLKEELKEPVKLLEDFAYADRANWGEKKSLEFPHVTVGFRTSNRVNKQKQLTWDAVLEGLKKNPKFKKFIRVKEEINKEAILALNSSNENDKSILKQLKDECSLYIDHPEGFYVQVKKEAA